MERTAGRCTLHFRAGFYIFIPSHTRSRPPSLILFSLGLMRVLVVIAIGAVCGALEGVGIFFEPKEPYKWHIFCAATLKCILVALLTGLSLVPTMRWWSGAGVGALYGLAMALVVYLAKGGPSSGDAPYLLPGGLITGAIVGVLILRWGFQPI